MLFGNKFKLLASFAGKEKITADEVASLNIELEENGVTAVSFVDRSQEAQTDVQALRDQLTEANSQLTAAQDALTAMTTERDNLQKELESAAEGRTTVKKAKDKEAVEKKDWNDPNADYNQRASKAVGQQ